MLADKNGYYGEFGGAFVPAELQRHLVMLGDAYAVSMQDESFQRQYKMLLKDFAGRSTPLYAAKNLSQKYKAKIYIKREDLSVGGSHHSCNALGQILLAQQLGKKQVLAETGSGQHGVAVAMACNLFGLPCTVFMGKKDVQRQQHNVLRMHALGAKLVEVESGSQTLYDAAGAAWNAWKDNPGEFYYAAGSTVGPHPYPAMVTGFQSIISREIKQQLAEQGNGLPTYVLACVGSGSSAAGSFYHFINEETVGLIGAEAAGKGVKTGKTAASLSNGSIGIIQGSRTYGLQSEGAIAIPHSIAPGLDYPAAAPLHSYLHAQKRATYTPVNDFEAMEAAYELMTCEGIIPGLEAAHAFALLKKHVFNESDNVVICLSSGGDKDMLKYEAYRDVMQD